MFRIRGKWTIKRGDWTTATATVTIQQWLVTKLQCKDAVQHGGAQHDPSRVPLVLLLLLLGAPCCS